MPEFNQELRDKIISCEQGIKSLIARFDRIDVALKRFDRINETIKRIDGIDTAIKAVPLLTQKFDDHEQADERWHHMNSLDHGRIERCIGEFRGWFMWGLASIVLAVISFVVAYILKGG